MHVVRRIRQVGMVGCIVPAAFQVFLCALPVKAVLERLDLSAGFGDIDEEFQPASIAYGRSGSQFAVGGGYFLPQDPVRGNRRTFDEPGFDGVEIPPEDRILASDPCFNTASRFSAFFSMSSVDAHSMKSMLSPSSPISYFT